MDLPQFPGLAANVTHDSNEVGGRVFTCPRGEGSLSDFGLGFETSGWRPRLCTRIRNRAFASWPFAGHATGYFAPKQVSHIGMEL